MRGSIVALALVASVPAAADGPSAADVTPYLAYVLADPDITKLYGQCPADMYRSRRSAVTTLFGPLGRGDASCAANVTTCVALFRYAWDPKACVSLARTFQEYEEEVGKVAHGRLFALACAVGSASGCTNRAAGIRNDPVASDPLDALPPSTRDDCVARTFRLACDAKDAWGCAMYGQALIYGEGVAADQKAAGAANDRACELAASPNSPACAFARRTTTSSARAPI